ncbi:MAG: hypothetical protein ACFFD4_08800 [Candidatus Odinarchaeota archaeon]
MVPIGSVKNKFSSCLLGSGHVTEQQLRVVGLPARTRKSLSKV